MNVDLWFKWLNAVVLVGSVATNVFLFFSSKRDTRFARVNACLQTLTDKQLSEASSRKAHDGELDKRISVMEEKVKGLPTHDDLEQIRGELATIGANVATVSERSRVTMDSMRRIENHLLERNR
ncbi:DUF2730 family protein [Pseudoxanthomonas sp. UTMC 1351]|uniref:DUF2730 family protein n=1 Tax=Pseudoxanthomonas sp. UTMC 1351 TaxID=2695853 RepID=UPI0034CD762C